MITDQQVVLLRQKLMEGKTQQGAAASAAMSERSARKWQRGSLPSESKRSRRRWRSRPDPFADVWESDVVPLLLTDPDGELSATTILEWLDERYPGRFGNSQLRTLQRRIATTGRFTDRTGVYFHRTIHPGGRPRWTSPTARSWSDHRRRALQTPAVPACAESLRLALRRGVLRRDVRGAGEGLQGALWELGACPAWYVPTTCRRPRTS